MSAGLRERDLLSDWDPMLLWPAEGLRAPRLGRGEKDGAGGQLDCGAGAGVSPCTHEERRVPPQVACAFLLGGTHGCTEIVKSPAAEAKGYAQPASRASSGGGSPMTIQP